MALPKEPRQKMINIMYLVLTALLAINISAEILNAFKTINNSLEKTNGQVAASSAQIMKSLNEKALDPKTAEKAAEWKPKAEAVMSQAQKAYAFIDALKKELIEKATSGGKLKEDDQNTTTRLLIKEGKGKELFKILEDYKKNVLAVDPKIQAEFANGFQVNLDKPVGVAKNKNWEESYFYMSPTVGALSILSKFQNDIRTSENKIVTFCHEQVGKVDIVFDSYAAIIGQSSNYVMPGEKFMVNAGVGAYSKAAQPVISIGGSTVGIGEQGFASKEITAGTPGEYTVPVRISYFNQTTGKQEEKIENVKYTVGSPGGASVALDKMNVFYINVDNPITIASSTGWDKTKVAISGGGGSLVPAGGNGKYNVRVNSVTDECLVTVTADGKPSVFKFRVRTIPDPIATVGTFVSGDNVPAGAFRAQAGVSAWIKDFPFDLKYTVQSFVVEAEDPETGDIIEAPCTGNTWSPKAQSAINKQKSGLITIRDIRAIGPDGRVRKLNGIYYNIK